MMFMDITFGETMTLIGIVFLLYLIARVYEKNNNKE